MSIQIATRLHPLSHLPGTMCLLPRTGLKLQIFPTRVNVFAKGKTFALHLKVDGPVKDFTVEVDLEQENVRVFGTAAHGFLRYIISAKEDGMHILFEKIPQQTLSVTYQDKTYTLSTKETVHLPYPLTTALSKHMPDRLSLGMHKAQDWELVKRRLDLKEIFPSWMRLGQITPPPSSPPTPQGNLVLLERCRELIQARGKLEIIKAFTLLFMAGCEGILMPRFFDTDFQGIAPLPALEEDNPLALHILTQGAALIRSLFLQEEKGALSILPCLPPDFHAGRLLAHTHLGERLELEWSKKQIMRLNFYPTSSRRVRIVFAGGTQCRIKSFAKDRGVNYKLDSGVLDIDVKADCPLFFDRFQK